MLFAFQKIVEKRIQEAQGKGDFENLPGSGQPIQLEDDSHIPEELRLAYKILKNAGCIPPELQLQKDIRQMEDMLEGIPDEKQKYRQIKKINYQIMKLNIKRCLKSWQEADDHCTLSEDQENLPWI